MEDRDRWWLEREAEGNIWLRYGTAWGRGWRIKLTSANDPEWESFDWKTATKMIDAANDLTIMAAKAQP